MKLLMVAAVLVFGAPAAAQTTTCRPFGGEVVCRTHDTAPAADYPVPSAADSYINNMRRLQALETPPGVVWDDVPTSETPAEKESQIAPLVGSLLRDGKCSAAINLALSSGFIDLATSAKRFCSKSPETSD